MSEQFVRVRLDNGMETSVSRAFAEGENLTVLENEPATNSWGRPLPATRKNGRPAKPRTTVKKAVAKRAPAATRTTTTGGSAAARSEEGTE